MWLSMLNKFLNLISSSPDEQNVKWLNEYLKTNHGKIVRKAYSGDYELPTAITFVFKHLCKLDSKLETEIRNMSPNDGELTAVLFSLVSGKPMVCENNKTRVFKNPIKGFGYCGTNKNCECYMNRPELRDESIMKARQEKRTQTMIDRYGVDNPMKNDDMKIKMLDNRGDQTESFEKMAKTNLERYGAANVFASKEIKEKIAATNTEKYGAANPMQIEEFRNKQRNSYTERTGFSHPFVTEEAKNNMRKAYQENKDEIVGKIKETQEKKYGTWYASTDEFREKSIETIRQKYSVDNAAQSEEIKAKIKATNLERYGGHPAQNEQVKATTASTMMDRFGGHFSQQNISKEALAILDDKELLESKMANSSVTNLSIELGVDETTIYKRCQKFDIDYGNSSYENEISFFLNNLNIEYIKRSRKIIPPLELDFYIPSHKFAIEFNGLYWHRESLVGKNYHADKLKKCTDAGIRLIMINEDEWLAKRDIILKKIENILNLSSKGPGARKLTVLEIDTKTANDFLHVHHIQGAPGTTLVSYGAYNGNDLVGVMSFNKQRGTEMIDLNRFCSDGKVYPGMFSKIFKYATSQNDWDTVVSFADCRYSRGELYENNGFVNTGTIPPDYRYFIGAKTFHKSSFTKTRIQEKFEVDMSEMTERQAMEALGYHRIYDCGKLKYVWNR